MAMQGKLVEQRPEEGTGEELYQQIQKEKQKLIKEGKIKKQKPLPEITEEEVPFEIPESWKWVRLGSVSEIARGGSPRPIKAYTTNQVSGVNWIKISDSDIGGKYIFSTKEKIRPEGISKSRYVHAGDFLLTNSMSYGRPYILKCNGCIHDGWLVISNYQSAFDIEFLYYLLSSSFVFHEFQNEVSGAVVKNLNSEKVSLTIIPLVPLSEQKRIVAKIEEIMPFIDRYAVAYDHLQSYNTRFPDDLKKSILQMAIQGKLVPQDPNDEPASVLLEKIAKAKQKLIKEGKIKKQKPLPEITEEEIPFDIPESWEWVRLTELGYFSSGKTPDMTRKEYWENGTVNWFTSKDMKKKYLDQSILRITETAAEDLKEYHPGTILMVVRSGILKRMLPICIMTQSGTINQDIKAFELFENAMSDYIYSMLKALEPNILLNYTKRVTTVDSLKFDEFSRQMLVPVPPLAEQKRIVAKLYELLPQIDGLK